MYDYAGLLVPPSEPGVRFVRRLTCTLMSGRILQLEWSSPTDPGDAADEAWWADLEALVNSSACVKVARSAWVVSVTPMACPSPVVL